MVEFITGASGSGKTTLMFQKIKEASETSEKQCVIVPEQYSYEFDKNLYGYLGAERFNSLFSSSFTGLARQLFQLYGEPNRTGEYADELARMILVYQAILEVQSRPDTLNFFRNQSSKNGFAEELIDLISDMKRSGVTPQLLKEKSVSLDKKLMDKTNDIADIYFEYERLMNEYGFKDNLENIREAAKIANLNEYFKGKDKDNDIYSGYDIYIDEFESFTGDQIEMIKVMFSSAKNVYITLRTDNVNAGKYTLFETVNDTYRQLKTLCVEMNKECKTTTLNKTYRFHSDDLEYLSTNIMRNLSVKSDKKIKSDNIKIFESKDMYNEIEYVCATIKRLICEDKSLRYREIAVISNKIENYAEIIKTAFERYEIPYFLSLEKPVTHTSIMVFFTSLLDLLKVKKIKSEQVFQLLKCNILSIELDDTAFLENFCYKYKVDGKMWEEPFDIKSSDEKVNEEVERAEELRKTIITPIVTLRNKIKRKNNALEICTLLYNYLVECEAEKKLANTMNELVNQNQDYEANEIKRIWGCIVDILDSIASTLKDKEISFSEVTRIIKSMIGKIHYSVPPQTIDSVTVASSRTARLNAPKIVFAIGSNEGDFPNQVSLHSLFSESDKEKLFSKNIKISRQLSELVASERLIVYKSFSTASDKLFITYPLSDLSGNAKYASPVISQVQSMFGNNILSTENDIPIEYYAVTIHSAFYHYMQNVKENNTQTASLEHILSENSEYSNRIKNIKSKAEHSNDSSLTSDIMEKLKDFSVFYISPTALETFNDCHFKYFCKTFLKLITFEEIDLDAKCVGNIAHECFHKIIEESKENFVNLSKEELKEKIDKISENYKENNLAGDFGKTPKFNLFFNKFKESLLTAFEYTQDSFKVSDFKPVEFEYRLEREKAFSLTFEEGKKLKFTGTVDRIDTYTTDGQNYIRIIDYKSGEKKIDEKLLSGGLNMQTLIYLFATTEKNSKYSGYVPAGVLYSPFQVNGLDYDNKDDDKDDQKGKKKNFKSQGLLIEDVKVVNAMEHGINGDYIPAKINSNLVTFNGRESSCIPLEQMYELKDYVYDKLKEMAKSVHEGDIEALPSAVSKTLSCENCDYCDICGKSDSKERREPDEKDKEKAKRLLGKNGDKKEAK